MQADGDKVKQTTLPPTCWFGLPEVGADNSNLNGKEFDNIVNRIHKPHQRWDNGLRFPLSDLGERYVRGDLMVLLDLSANSSKNIFGNRFTLGISHGLPHDVNTCASREFDLTGGSYNHQFPMFIESVHIVDDAERVISASVPRW